MQESRHLVLATVISVRDGHVTYPCCIQCYSKLFSDCTQNSWRCNKCGTAYRSEELEWRYRLALTITDNKSICNICVFGRLLEPAFGISASKFYRCYKHLQDNCSDAEEILTSALKHVFIGKCFYFGLKTPLHSRNLRKPVDLQDIVDSYKLNCTNLTQSENEWRTEYHTNIVAYQMIPAAVTGCVVTVVDVLNEILHPELQPVSAPMQNGSVDFSRVYLDSFSRSKISDSTRNSQDSFGQSTAILSCDLTNSHSTLSNLGHLTSSLSKNTPGKHDNKPKAHQNLLELPPLPGCTTSDSQSQGNAETFHDEEEQYESVLHSDYNKNLSRSFSNDASSLLLRSFSQQTCEDDYISDITGKLKASYSDRKITNKHNRRKDVEVENVQNNVVEHSDRYFAHKIRLLETLTENGATNKANKSGSLSTLECEDNFEGNDGSFIQELDSQCEDNFEGNDGSFTQELDIQEHLDLVNSEEYDETDQKAENNTSCKDGYTNQHIQVDKETSYCDADIDNAPTRQVIVTNDISVSNECFLLKSDKHFSDQDEILVSKMFDKTMPDSEDIEEYLNSSEFDVLSQNVYEDNNKVVNKPSHKTNLQQVDATKDKEIYSNMNSDHEMIKNQNRTTSIETNGFLELKKEILNSKSEGSQNIFSESEYILHQIKNGSSHNKQPADEINSPVCSPKRPKLQDKTVPGFDCIRLKMDDNETSVNVQSQEKPRFEEDTMALDVRSGTYVKAIDVDDLENVFNDSFNEEVSKIDDNILLMKHGTSNLQDHLLSKPLDLYKSSLESQIVEEEKLSQLRNITFSQDSISVVDIQDVEQSEASCLDMESYHIVQEDKFNQLKNISLSNNDAIRNDNVSQGEDSCCGNGSVDLFGLSDISNCSSKIMYTNKSRSEYSNYFKTSKAEHSNDKHSLFVLDETENISICSDSSTGRYKNKSQLLNETTDTSQPCKTHVLKKQSNNSLKEAMMSDVSRKQNFKSVQFANRLSSFKSVQLIDLQMKLKQKSCPVINDHQIKSCLKEPVLINDSKLCLKETMLSNGLNPHLKESMLSNSSNPYSKESLLSNGSSLCLKEPLLSIGSGLCFKKAASSINDSNSSFKEPVYSNGSKDHKNIVLPLQNLKLNFSQDEIFMSQDLFTPSPVHKTDKENHHPKNQINSQKRKSYSICVSTPKSVLTPIKITNSMVQTGLEPLFSDSCDFFSYSKLENQTSLSRSLIKDKNCHDKHCIIPSENSVEFEEQSDNNIESPCLFSQSEDLFSETKENLYNANPKTDNSCCEKGALEVSTGYHREIMSHNLVELSPDLFNSDAESESSSSFSGVKSSLKTFPVKRLFPDNLQ